MAWSPDFCLACDCQTNGEVYCSQACRLDDLERTSPRSESTSLVQPLHAVSRMPTSSSIMGFFLPPAVEFSAYRSRPWATMSSSGDQPGAGPTSTLTPSSSQSSLVSMRSAITHDDGRISDQARTELQAYASSFDRVRDWRRRVRAG